MSHANINLTYEEFEEIISDAIRTTIDKFRTDMRYLHCQLRELHQRTDDLRRVIEDYAIQGRTFPARILEVEKVPKPKPDTVEKTKRSGRGDKKHWKFRNHES